MSVFDPFLPLALRRFREGTRMSLDGAHAGPGLAEDLAQFGDHVFRGPRPQHRFRLTLALCGAKAYG